MAKLYKDLTKTTDDLLTKNLNAEQAKKQERRNINFKTGSNDGKVTFTANWAQLFDDREKSSVELDWALDHGFSFNLNTNFNQDNNSITKVQLTQNNKIVPGLKGVGSFEFDPNENTFSDFGYNLSVQFKKQLDEAAVGVNASGGRSLEKKATNAEFALAAVPKFAKVQQGQISGGFKVEGKNLAASDEKAQEINTQGGLVFDGDKCQVYVLAHYDTKSEKKPAKDAEGETTEQTGESTPDAKDEKFTLPVGFTIGGSMKVKDDLCAAIKFKLFHQDASNELQIAGQKCCGNESVKAKLTVPIAGEDSPRVGLGWKASINKSTNLNVFADLNSASLLGKEANGAGHKFGGKLSFNTVD